jgi:beta-galactosidase
MPYRKESSGDWQPEQTAGYISTLRQLHRALYQADMPVDILPAGAPADELAKYELIVIPSLYVADDATLARIADYVRAGGHVLATFKSGVANENDAIRWERLPGPLKGVAGFTYQEFTSLATPVPLKGNPMDAGAAGVALDWAEYLVPTTAQVLARYDDPIIGTWPAITRNVYGRGTFTYEGSAVSDALQYAVVRDTLDHMGLAHALPARPGPVRTRTAIDRQGRTLRFLMNFSSSEERYHYPFRDGVSLLAARPIASGDELVIPAWDLLIVRER